MSKPDRAIEHLLRQGAAKPPTEASAPCLDADTLAAWVDGRLSRTELAAAESHAAGCARCQAMLAVMARTSDAGNEAAAIALAPRRRFWRMLPWMGPVAAAATAAAIYVAVRPRVDVVSTPAQEVAVASRDSAPTPDLARPPQAVLDPAVAPRQSAPARVNEKDQSDREKAAKNVAQAEAPPAPREQLQKPSAFGGLSTSIPVPQMPPAATERPTAAPAATLPAAPIVSEELKRRESFQARGAAAAGAGARADALLDFTSVPLVVQSPDLDIQWRVVAGNVVQRTTDRGRTWVTQATGTTKAIAAGFSPSATVCWLVGAGGVVAVTTDGKTWTPVPFPHAIDLTNVQASSADAAVVFAADGRTFTTADRGKSWK